MTEPHTHLPPIIMQCQFPSRHCPSALAMPGDATKQQSDDRLAKAGWRRAEELGWLLVWRLHPVPRWWKFWLR
ncbi:MAG TPA: hypothetical protein VFR23_17860 [Jiangellaceae bacterium]|nr:hypothetical protein [Jiangellaceae bacterium]